MKEGSLEIVFEKVNDLLVIQGRSTGSNTIHQYFQLVTDIIDHLAIRNRLVIKLKYEVFNADTIKYMSSIIKVLNDEFDNGKEIKMCWTYGHLEDTESKKAVKHFRLLANFEFDTIYKNSRNKVKGKLNENTSDDQKLIFSPKKQVA